MSSTLPSLDRAIELQPEIPRALRGLVAAAKRSALDPVLIHLIEVRASQINGCAFCLDMHLAHARNAGIDQQRLDLLSVWRETSFFNDRERAALAWCEALTSPQDKHALRAKPYRLGRTVRRNRNRQPHCRSHCHQRLESHRRRSGQHARTPNQLS